MRSIDDTQQPQDMTSHCHTNYYTTYNHLTDNEPITLHSSSENRRHNCITCSCHNVCSPKDLKIFRSLNRNQIIIGWIPHCETCVCNAIFQSDTENSDTSSPNLESDNESEDPSYEGTLHQINRSQHISPIDKEAKNCFQSTQHPKLDKMRPEKIRLTMSIVRSYTVIIGITMTLTAIALNVTGYISF